MPGKKEINADLELKGKLTIHTVPVATGTGVFVYNPTTKEASQRTYAQFIADLSLSTTTHTHTFASITSKPTTVAGYGITNAMTTSHVANGITSTNISNWNTAYTNSHTHSNKAFLDTINQNLGSTDVSTFASVNINNGSNTYRAVNFYTSGSLRWLIGVNSSVENGTNGVGSDFELHMYNNDSSYKGQILHISRATGIFEVYYPFRVASSVSATSFVKVDGTSSQFMKADGSVDGNTYAINNGTSTWYAMALGLTLNPTVYGGTLNGLNQTVPLSDATQGNTAGIVNTSGTVAGNPTDNWYHRIKMLHPNTAGYYTEIAVQMTGGSTMWFKTLEAGTIRNGAIIPSGWIQVVDNLNDQVVRGTKTFEDNTIFQRSIQLYDEANEIYGRLRYNDDFFSFQTDLGLVLGIESNAITLKNTVLAFPSVYRNYTFPNKNGTVALTSDLPVSVNKTITTSTYTVRPDDKDNLIIFTANNVVVTVNNSSLTGVGSAVQFEFLGTGTLTCVSSGAQILVNKNRSPVSDGINSTMVLQRLTEEATSKFKLYGELV